MSNLFLLWLFLAVAIFLITGSPSMGQARRQRELMRPLPSRLPDPPSPSAFVPESGWGQQPTSGGDDLDEGVSAEMPDQESLDHCSPAEAAESQPDDRAQELLRAITWSEIFQPPLALRRPRR